MTQKKMSSRENKKATSSTGKNTSKPAMSAKSQDNRSQPLESKSSTSSAASRVKKTLSLTAKPISRAAASVKNVLSKLTGRSRAAESVVPETSNPRETAAKSVPRVVRATSDIPMEQIEETYIPGQTSLKGPFRSSGADRGHDADLDDRYGDDKWNDEDRLTNKSGDPRIGTHHRTYEPGESRQASADNTSK